MNTLQFKCWRNGRSEERQAPLRQLVVAGWTGRDRAALDKHIHELAQLGIPGPKTLPTYYRGTVNLITTATEIQVLGPHSSGEVEFFLVALEDGLWVGVGSDHTDRKVETYAIDVSKQLCQKVMAPELWWFDDVRPHWDRLILRAHIQEGGRPVLYQEGAVAELRRPEELIATYAGASERLAPGTLMCGGTFSAIGGVRPAGEFAMELEDPVLKRKLSHHYQVEVVPKQE